MKSTQDLIEDELLRLCRKGDFEAFMLFNSEGIPMAGVGQPIHYNEDAIAALSVIINQSTEISRDFDPHVGIDEFSIRTTNKFRIVSRPFQISDDRLILVAVVPRDLSYRKITSEAVQKIQQFMAA